MHKNSLQSLTLAVWPFSRASKKFLVMLAVAFYTFGLTGAGAIFIMSAMSYAAFARDSSQSHGISARDSSRLGGVSILITFSVFVLLMTYLSPYTPGVLREPFWGYFWGGILSCCAIGLVEDFKADTLTPFIRLVLKAMIFGGLLWAAPVMVPDQIGILWVDLLLKIDWLAWVLCTVFCVGFINAFNMSDGANGLVPGICLCTFIVLFDVYGRPAEGILVFACSMFLLFNVVSGWFFLGDTGSYGLGAIIVSYGLLGVAQGDFSAGFMACLVAYPCIDFVYSLLRRIVSGASPFRPDNGHLHNHLHNFYRPFFNSKVMSNSLTGLSISGATSGLALAMYLQSSIPITSNLWFWLFGFQAILYVMVIGVLTRRQGRKAPQ
jgi:UDP-N-acetylmuramyl pentapeptide phosphotransferase/UDP-N-acetylglucosamine-1-phosphate transferase